MTEPRMQPNPTPNQIIEALGKTGFLLEQRVGRVFEQHSFTATIGRSFMDPDEGKSREIDVHAYRQFIRDENLRQSIGARVIVECKNTPNPFVAIGQPPSDRERERAPEEHQFRFMTVAQHAIDGRYIRKVDIWRWLQLDQASTGPGADEFRGAQLVRLDRKNDLWDASNSSVFDTLVYPLAKAVRAFQPKNNISEKWRGPSDWAHTDLTFPLVVTNGPIYQVDMQKVLNPEVTSVRWTTITRDLQALNIKGKFNIDVNLI